MRKTSGLFFVIVMIALSCSSDRVPKNVIQPEEMKMILYDLFRSEEAATKLKLDSSINTFTNRQLVMYNNVFAIHHIGKDAFYKSYRYYEEHPDLHKELMDSLSAFAGREKIKSYQRLPQKTAPVP